MNIDGRYVEPLGATKVWPTLRFAIGMRGRPDLAQHWTDTNRLLQRDFSRNFARHQLSGGRASHAFSRTHEIHGEPDRRHDQGGRIRGATVWPRLTESAPQLRNRSRGPAASGP